MITVLCLCPENISAIYAWVSFLLGTLCRKYCHCRRVFSVLQEYHAGITEHSQGNNFPAFTLNFYMEQYPFFPAVLEVYLEQVIHVPFRYCLTFAVCFLRYFVHFLVQKFRTPFNVSSFVQIRNEVAQNYRPEIPDKFLPDTVKIIWAVGYGDIFISHRAKKLLREIVMS